MRKKRQYYFLSNGLLGEVNERIYVKIYYPDLAQSTYLERVIPFPSPLVFTPGTGLKRNKPEVLKTALWSFGHPLLFISLHWYLKLILKFSRHSKFFPTGAFYFF